MERLEKKKINGSEYYYYSRWEWVDGKSRRVWQKYLGKLEDIVKAVQGDEKPLHAEVFDMGLVTALWNEIKRFGIIEIIDKHCPKRNQGLSVGEYIAVAAINRAIHGVSKNAMWEWFSKTSLVRLLPKADEKNLSSKRFWDHMDMITPEISEDSWQAIIEEVTAKEDIDMSSISYDGTNFYSFINTFNTRNQIAQRGKNKQGRDNLRQISYGLFCTRDGQIPLYYDVYEGNRNDAREFPEVVKRFNTFLQKLPNAVDASDKTTLIFDKGNNSADNIQLLDDLGVHFVGSVKLGEHKELAEISNKDPRFQDCQMPSLKGIKCFTHQKEVYGKERRILVTFNQELFDAQLQTVDSDIEKATVKLAALQQRLQDRKNGLIKGGHKPTEASVGKSCKDALKRPYLKDIITYALEIVDGHVVLEYEINWQKKFKIMDTYLGKKLIITTRLQWEDDAVIDSYHSQYVIEHVFREMKDSKRGTWWPLFHWTDQKIEVHGLYSSLAILIRNSIHRRLKRQGIDISMNRLTRELSNIKEVINIFEVKRKKQKRQTVLSKTNELQDQIIKALELNF